MELKAVVTFSSNVGKAWVKTNYTSLAIICSTSNEVNGVQNTDCSGHFSKPLIEQRWVPDPAPVPPQRVSQVATIMHGLTLSVSIIILKIFQTNSKVEKFKKAGYLSSLN